MNSPFSAVLSQLSEEGFNIISQDVERPWGGFFVIDETQSQDFADRYFGGQDVSGLRVAGKLSPKILLVKPEARLSWQYHHRRAETWRVIEGPVGIVRSDTDEEGELVAFEAGDTVVLQKGERHRLIGLKNWGIVAEFWQHTDPKHPSDENDIVRVQDDYKRSTPA